MRLPTQIKKIRGTLRPDRVARSEAATLALPRVIRAPAWLSPEAAVIWRQLVEVLRKMKVLGRQDLGLVAMLADQTAQYEAASRALTSKGSLTFVILDGDGAPKGVLPYPEIKIKAACAVEIRRLAEHFGLSPASRSRVSAIGAAEGNRLDEFVSRPSKWAGILK